MSVSVCVCGAVLCLCEECVSGWVRRTDDGSHLGRPTWPTAVMEMHNCDHGDGKPGRRARVIMRFWFDGRALGQVEKPQSTQVCVCVRVCE